MGNIKVGTKIEVVAYKVDESGRATSAVVFRRRMKITTVSTSITNNGEILTSIDAGYEDNAINYSKLNWDVEGDNL